MTTLNSASLTPTGFATPVAEALPAVVDRLVAELHPDKIILFGSYAYGQPTTDSDVDLLIVMDTDVPPLQRYVLVSRLLWPCPFPVDILVKRPDEIEVALAAGDFFMAEIVAKGQVLYDRDK